MTTPDSPVDDQEYYSRLLMNGNALNLERVGKLEKSLLDEADDVKTRLLLLGYYMYGYHKDPERGQNFVRHLTWMIDNQPENPALQHVPLFRPDEHFRVVKKHWLSAIRRNPCNVVILDHAARCARMPSPKDAEKFWLMAQKLEPLSEEWPLALSNSLGLRANNPEWRADRNLALKSCRYGQIALDLHEKYPKSSYLETYLEMNVSSMVSRSLAFGFADYAMYFGAYLVRLGGRKSVPDTRQGRLDYQAHMGHSSLGRAALMNGDTALAIEHLGKMAVLGDPDWRHDLLLAQELLDLKEKDAVNAYLEGCIQSLIKRRQSLEATEVTPNDMPALISIEYENHHSMTFNQYVSFRLDRRIERLADWRAAIGKKKKIKFDEFI